MMGNEFIEKDVATILPKVWSLEDIAEMAWGVIANVNGGEWNTREVSPEWRGAAERWRDQYHAYLKRTRPSENSDVDVAIEAAVAIGYDLAQRRRVAHPPHYNWVPGVEAIDVVEHFSFNPGNALKYIWRAPVKEKSEALVDYKKAVFYLQREIDRLEREI